MEKEDHEPENASECPYKLAKRKKFSQIVSRKKGNPASALVSTVRPKSTFSSIKL
jgi:hypothetical protein